MSFYDDKKKWILSFLKNNAQHRKLRAYIDELKTEIKILKSQNNAEINAIRSENQALRQQNNTILHYMRKLTPQASLRILEVHLAEHCNLHCFSCSHFSQLADSEYPSSENFERDLKRIKELGGSIERFHLMGGEPLLNPKCVEFFKITRKYFPNSAIWLVTNGILLPKQDDNFWLTCKEQNIEIHPTKYPIEIDWQIVENKCKEYDIKLAFYNNAKVEKTSNQFLLDEKGEQDAFDSFTKCFIANNCIQLVNGKLYTCNPAANVRFFNKRFGEHLPDDETNYIDIHKAQTFAEITQFLARPIPFCKYCKVNEWKSIGAWRHSERSKDEYFTPHK